MTAKEYLDQAYRLNELVNSHLAEIDELRSLSCSISGINFGERVDHTRSTEPSFVSCIDKLVDMEKELGLEIDRLIALKGEINSAIKSLSRPDERMLLRYRYVNHYSWSKIGILMNVSNRTVHRIHSSAIKNFSVPK